MIILIIVVLLLFGGGGYWGYRGGYYGGRGFGGILGLLLIVLILFLLFGGRSFAQVGNNPAGSNLFYPGFGLTKTLSATTSSVSATLTGNGVNDTSLMVYNSGVALVFCRWGVGAQTALVNVDFPVPAGTVQVMHKPYGDDTVACISLSGTNLLYLTPGYGK